MPSTDRPGGIEVTLTEMRLLLPLLVGLALVLAAAPSTAAADVRTLIHNDPEDATPPVSGQPNNPDIKSVEATYDDAQGQLTLSVAFYNALDELDTSEVYSMYAYFHLDSACFESGGDSIEGQHHVLSDYTQFYDRAQVSGYSGYLNFQREVSADQKSVTISATAPALQGKDYKCLTYRILGRARADRVTSNYDPDCGCYFFGRVLDELGEGRVYFPGYSPEELPRVETVYRQQVQGKCRRINLSYWEVLPDQVYGSDRRFSGDLAFVLRGEGRSRRLRTGLKNQIVWRGLSPGRYEIRGRYTGDEWRLPSRTVARSVRVRGC